MKNFIKKYERQIKTFFEAFASYIAINIMTSDLNSKSAVYGLIAGAIGSALSVLMNIDRNKQTTFNDDDFEEE